MNKLIKTSIFLLSILAGCVEAREIVVQVTVPDSAWKISIDSVTQVSNELWVVSTVSRDPQMMGAQVISKVKATVTVNASDLPVKYFVIGKTWGWEKDSNVTFIKSASEIAQELGKGKTLYRRTEPEN